MMPLTHLDKRSFLAREDGFGRDFWNWSGFSLSWGGHTLRHEVNCLDQRISIHCHLDILGRQPTLPLPSRLILGLKS